MAEDSAIVIRDRRHSAETRDPRGATGNTSYSWVTPGRPTVARWDGQQAFLQGYYAETFTNRAINIIADRIAALPFRAGPNPDEPGKYDQNAPLARLLGPPPGTPNPELTARQLWKSGIINYLVTGRFAWEIERGGQDGVIGLWPLVIGGLKVIPTDKGRAYFSGFEYSVNGTVNPIEYRREEVVYGWNAAPDDPRESESPLRSLSYPISVAVQIDQYFYAFMKNDAKPATLVVHGPFATDDAQRAFRDQFMANHAGPLNANKTMFTAADPDDNGNVAGTLDIKQIGATAKDSQMAQLREQMLDSITSGLGVPMSLMDASGRTFDNAGQEAQNFYELRILPLCADLQDHVNRDLAPKVGEEVGWFDLSKVQALRPRLAEGWSAGDVKDKLLTDEIRSFAGLGPVDKQALLAEKQENIALAQSAQTQIGVDSLAKAKAEDNSNDPTPGQNPVDQTDAQAPEKDGEDPKKTPAQTKKPPARVPTRQELTESRVLESRSTAVTRLEILLARQLAVLTERSLRATESRATGKRGRQLLETRESVDAVYERTYWFDETRQAIEPVYSGALLAASAALAGLMVNAEVDELRWWVEQRARDVAYSVVDARWNKLRLGVDDTATPETLVEAVRQAHVDTPALTELRPIAESAYDDAVRQLTGVPRGTVRDLLIRMTTGDIDVDRALGELTDG